MELCLVPSARLKLRAVRDMLGLAEGQYYAEALFLNATEILSLQMLFVLEGGYNGSTLNDMKIGNFRADDRESDPPVEMRGAREAPPRLPQVLLGDAHRGYAEARRAGGSGSHSRRATR